MPGTEPSTSIRLYSPDGSTTDYSPTPCPDDSGAGDPPVAP